MPAEPSPKSTGVLTSVRAGLNAGSLCGVLAGLFDGIVCALGIDPAFFVLRWQHSGLVSALFGGVPDWRGFGWLLGLLGCIAASATVYGLLGLAGGLLSGVVLHPLQRRRTLERRYRTILGLGFGVWIFLELFFWTRPIILPGLASTDPRRLAAAAGLLAVGLVFGLVLARLGRRMPRGLRLATPFLVVGALLAGGAFLFADTSSSEHIGRKNERNADLPNVLLFVVDALRQDVLGCYGADGIESPEVDALAARGVVFDEAFVQAPFTWTSFGSLLTGKYPRRHGLVRMEPGVRMAPNVTLAYHLKQAQRKDGRRLGPDDFVGAAFMTGTLSQGSGLLQGFDLYFEALVGHELVDIHSRWSKFRSGLLLFLVKNKLGQRFDNQIVASTAIDWFRSNAQRRFVAMVHYYSTHTPYDPPGEFRDKYVDPGYDGPIHDFRADYREKIERGEYQLTGGDEQQIKHLYYGGVSHADKMIGDVVRELERQGVLDDTIIVVTSDHGEELGDHGLWEHNFMYQTNLRIPLIMAWPKGLAAGTRVDALVDEIDLLPTICDLMGLELPVDPDLGERGIVDGVSLLPLIRGEADSVREYSFAENGRFRSIQSRTRKLIVRRAALEDGGWAKVLAGELEEPRFFDLERDPHETRNVFAERRADAQVLYDALKQWSDSMPIGDHLVIRSARDQDAELLDALGYGGGVGEGAGDEEEE